ncbi:GNAT superfamily N-acetyltransferase [Streptosporangium album]|uniref:GNAT superfamily N-acetyltransferase n=1 Tax=Streptosporangium album TaxID=47479 RepID=A0A7W7S649_9ACTN|nr:GNAT family N-acetyltransferase [Streptosporangium album]MBB4944417.1 GNAT superfamily N-acetyltransferase [Streptosporangium album]
MRSEPGRRHLRISARLRGGTGKEKGSARWLCSTHVPRGRLGDFEHIIRLYRQLQPDDPELKDGSDVVVFQQILKSPALHLFVLELDGVIVATSYLNVIPNITRSASPYAIIENVVVEESRRGTGLGKQIMAGTLQAAWDAGCYKAMLMTGSRRPATHAFYRACGFSADAKQAYVARPS